MLSVLPLRAENASDFRETVSSEDKEDNSENIVSVNNATPHALGLEVGQIQDKIDVSYFSFKTRHFFC